QDYHHARLWSKRAARHGNANALCNMGLFYLKGYGVPADARRAFDYYFAAATQAFAQAQWIIGLAYLEGTGVSQDVARALHWCRTAADSGSADAMNTLGDIYRNGRGVATNLEESFRWHYCAATSGHANAQVELGLRYSAGVSVAQDVCAAYRWYCTAAASGLPRAQRAVGYCHEYGEGTTQDYAAAVTWYRAAATQGYAAAEFDMGHLYYLGRGVPKDDTQAFAWFLKAAQQGHARACLVVAGDYENGCGVSKDRQRARRWYKRAARRGVTAAHLKLGLIYLTGVDTTPDYDKALPHLQAVTRAQDADTNTLVGAWLCMGGIHLMKGNTGKASYALQRAWAHTPALVRKIGAVAAAVAMVGVLCVLAPLVLLASRRRTAITWRTTDAVLVMVLFGVGQVCASLAVFVPLGTATPMLLRAIVWTTLANGAVVLIGAWIAWCRGWNVIDAFGLTRVAWRSLLATVVGGYAMVLLCNVAYVSLLKAFGITLKPQVLSELIALCHGPLAVSIILVCGGVLLPVCEELIFRSMLYPGLRARLGVWAALIVSALVFAAVHLELQYLVPLVVFGLVLAVTRERTRSVVPACVIHVLNNSIMLGITLYQ
ncbi:MAG: CPBP family glutamic-type intramembrane protease, partial [bacterium]|nr:CPBP family glutamic-type intramembrane protease [bacterium]